MFASLASSEPILVCAALRVVGRVRDLLFHERTPAELDVYRYTFKSEKGEKEEGFELA